MAIHDDIPPPYSAVGTHGVFPRASHDERARFNFLANLNKHVAGTLGPGNRLAYEKRVLPRFVAEHGREPADRFEVRRAMNTDPYHRFWSALKRNNMEMRQQNGRSIVLRHREGWPASWTGRVGQGARRSRPKSRRWCWLRHASAGGPE